ncbi:MAG: selenocysteine-specific translation elongation factor [Deltaproteobacteria bacterium]|nr:selenocysteine-specific translation elongation factor [Deltaproteobacteria bacterium]
MAEQPLRPLIVGTAGHIDHGKTSLVKALTGINTDRLKEEQKRGITIELGFAQLTTERFSFGIVDVPGHERFVKSMVSGAGGVDLVMLIIAADEGVMPQTREHLDICQLLDVRAGIVVLTKCDLVEDDWRELVTADIAQLLQSTFLAGAPILPCSANTGAGIAAIAPALEAQAEKIDDKRRDLGARLPFDRVFSIKGFGTVVTGTLQTGRLSIGEPIVILPNGLTCEIKRLQVHGEQVETATAGQRTAVNLPGIAKEALSRGEVAVSPNSMTATSMLEVELKLLAHAPALKADSKLQFHLGTAHTRASCLLLSGKRLEPGQSALAQLRLERPIGARVDDHFILRGFAKLENHGTTIGGGRVIRISTRRLRRRDVEAIALLEQLAVAENATRLQLEIRACGGIVSRSELNFRLPWSSQELEQRIAELVGKQALFAVAARDQLVDAPRFAALRDQVLQVVTEHHTAQPTALGIPRAELRSRLRVDEAVADSVIATLVEQDALVVDGQTCYLPTHQSRLRSDLQPILQALRSTLEQAALAPPLVTDLPQSIGLPAERVEAALRLLVDAGEVYRVGKLCFFRSAVDDLERRLRQHFSEHETIDAAGFKQLVGQSRKFAIPLAEFFDARRITVRRGDLRRLVG